MDATSFYGAANIGRHGRNRGKLPNTSVDAVFASILNGDVSEAELSDDELGEDDHVASVAAVEDELTGEFSSASSDEEASENENEKPAPKKKKEAVTWKTGPFTPKDTYCSYMPHGGSTPAEPLVYFQQYFSDAVFEELTRDQCLKLEVLEHTSIDEQMVPFSGRVPAKQVIKSKPNPVGVKIFVRCSSDGLAHDFEVYQGKGTGIDREYSYLGLGGCVVMRLADTLPHLQNLKLFFDNYFTSVLLLRELKAKGILATGTIRSNRLLGCKLKNEKEFRNQERGSLMQRSQQRGDVVLIRWKDNNLVTMASTQIGVGQIEIVKRWSAAKKEYTDVECPPGNC
ncbi:hypothetical protein MTO96_044349 [Rhipicephalus appendiculatus]